MTSLEVCWPDDRSSERSAFCIMDKIKIQKFVVAGGWGRWLGISGHFKNDYFLTLNFEKGILILNHSMIISSMYQGQYIML